MKKIIIILSILFIFWLVFGLYVVQPIGAVPEGVTILYIRVGTTLPFISSADGLIRDAGEDVTLFTRLAVMAASVKAMEGRIIVRLPYSEFLYLTSTGGVKHTQ